jgi:hypothetical protein
MMETSGRRTLERLREIKAGQIRTRVAEFSDSEVLGLLAGGTVVSIRWLILAGNEVRRELKGFARAVVTYREARRRRPPAGGNS